jgi:hypothetical protein
MGVMDPAMQMVISPNIAVARDLHDRVHWEFDHALRVAESREVDELRDGRGLVWGEFT